MQGRMFIHRCVLLMILACATLPLGAQEAYSSSYKASTTTELKIPIDHLEVIVKPLTVDELKVEAEAWIELLKEKLRKISDAELAVKKKREQIEKAEEAADAAVEAKEADEEAKKAIEEARKKGDAEALKDAEEVVEEAKKKAETAKKSAEDAVEAEKKSVEEKGVKKAEEKASKKAEEDARKAAEE